MAPLGIAVVLLLLAPSTASQRTCSGLGDTCSFNEDCVLGVCRCAGETCGLEEACVAYGSTKACVWKWTTTAPTTKTTYTTSTTGVYQEPCQDRMPECAEMIGYCYHSGPCFTEFMRDLCAQTCGLCPEPCEDKEPVCHLWMDLCHEPGLELFMFDNCARTCKLCSGLTTATAPTTITPETQACGGVACKPNEFCISILNICACYGAICAPGQECDASKQGCADITTWRPITTSTTTTTTTTTKEPCEDKEPPICQSWPNLCHEPGFELFVSDNCARTCGLCSQPCEDKEPTCPEMRDYCYHPDAYYRTQMREYCPKTCGLCPEIITTGTTATTTTTATPTITTKTQEHCEFWANECESSLRGCSADQQAQYCARTCGSSTGAAPACQPSTVQTPCGCFCKVGDTVHQCSATQDCDPNKGCVCWRPECQCGGEQCEDVDLCDRTVNKCMCGKDRQICKSDETCLWGECRCGYQSSCGPNEFCLNGQCIENCGNRTCSTFETCVRPNNGKPFCACGDFWRRCETTEVCLVSHNYFHCGAYCDQHACYCGKRICEVGQVCSTENGYAECKQACADSAKRCEDKEPTCPQMAGFCYNMYYLSYMRDNCALTCRLCPELCRDDRPDCATWNCYLPEFDAKGNGCAKTCKHC